MSGIVSQIVGHVKTIDIDAADYDHARSRVAAESLLCICLTSPEVNLNLNCMAGSADPDGRPQLIIHVQEPYAFTLNGRLSLMQPVVCARAEIF